MALGEWVVEMRFLYTSDLHGEISLYQELLELALSFSADILALGGDLLPSFAPTKRYEDMVPNQKTFIHQFLSPFFRKVIQNTPAQKVFLIPGNWDLGYPYLFEESTDKIIDLVQKSYRLENGFDITGYPFVPPTPFRPKDYEKMDDREAAWPPQKNPSYIRSPGETDELIAVDPYHFLRGRETIQEDLDQLVKPLDSRRTIYIMHSPPFGTKLDIIQGGHSAGSRSIRAFIGKVQPFLTLHGHIHEAPELSGTYVERIGKTLSINPGQFIGPGKQPSKLHAVTFEIEKIEETLTHTCLSEVRSSKLKVKS
jgi:Icc-related predicted phosphoesterase